MRTDLLKSVIRATVPRSLRNWLRSPSKSAEWLWDATRFELGATETVNFPRNWALICHPHAYRVFCQAQIADPDQRKEFENFLLHCDEKMFLLDIGAHFGVFSLAAAHFGGRAVAVDPSPTATRMIERECGLNGLTDSVRTIRAAVSDEAGAVDMISSGVFSDGYFRIMRGRSKSELTRARAITIDELVDQYGTPTHIKIDVEGQEAPVLRGGRATLSKSSPILFLELHNAMVAAEGGDPDRTLDELSSLRYETFSLEGDPFPRGAILKHPIVRVVATRMSDG
jgi:FkbM family methyltransferase